MQYPVKIILSTFFLTTVIADTYQSGAKLRRDGIMKLYPFPRVGRAAGSQPWQISPEEFYLEYEPAWQKRQMHPFPRIGRSDHSLREPHPEALQVQQARSPDSSGMWFGPRLGRSLQNDEEEYVAAPKNWRMYAFPRVGRSVPTVPGEMSPVPHMLRMRRPDNPGMWFGPRIGRSFGNDKDDISILGDMEHIDPEQMDMLQQEERKKRQVKQN